MKDWLRAYPWLPDDITNQQYDAIMMLAKGHSWGWVAQCLGISKQALHGRINRFANKYPEYYDNFRSILESNYRIREGLRHVTPLSDVSRFGNTRNHF